MKKLFLSVAMTLCLAAPAFAAAVPKDESTVTSDRITLGDVFDGVTADADHYLAPAPALGKTLTLGARDLARISEAFKLGWTPAAAAQHVTIRRAAGEIDRYDVQAALEKKLRDEMNGARFEMELADRAIGFRIPATGDRALNVENLAHDAVKGTFSAVVSTAADPGVRKEVSGRYYPISQIPVLRNPLRQGDVIAADDIDYVDMRAADITPTMMTDAASLVGRTPRRGIAAMKPVTLSDVQMPLVIKKGDLVTMTLKAGALSLTAQGRAMENGAVGDAVRVMNSTSRQVVDAVVTGALTVRIQAPQNAL